MVIWTMFGIYNCSKPATCLEKSPAFLGGCLLQKGINECIKRIKAICHFLRVLLLAKGGYKELVCLYLVHLWLLKHGRGYQVSACACSNTSNHEQPPPTASKHCSKFLLLLCLFASIQHLTFSFSSSKHQRSLFNPNDVTGMIGVFILHWSCVDRKKGSKRESF